MATSEVSYNVKLEALVRQEEGQWIAWSPSLDVMAQADSKARALKSLRGAVELWFESCIERGVLEEALVESGFWKAKPGGSNSDERGVDIVRVRASRTAPAANGGMSELIEVSIPAYIAAHRIEAAGSAAR